MMILDLIDDLIFILFDNLVFLSYLASWLYLAKERGHVEASVEVDSTQNHTLALDAHHLARSKVGYEEHILTDQLLWLIVGSDT